MAAIFWMSEPYCRACDTIIKDGVKHQCIVFINGYPATGENHGKESIFEFTETEVKIIGVKPISLYRPVLKRNRIF